MTRMGSVLRERIFTNHLPDKWLFKIYKELYKSIANKKKLSK